MKTIVMTGATNGLGAAAARQLADQGYRLVIIARDQKRGEETIASLPSKDATIKHSLYTADMLSVSEVKRVAKEIAEAEPSIDILINNAGATFSTRETTPEGIEKTVAINHLAPFILTLLLKDSLSKGARVVTTASMAHRNCPWDSADLLLERLYASSAYLAGVAAYSRSKLYNILFTRELARRWADRDVTVNCFHPGVVSTNFGKDELGFFEPLVKASMWLFGKNAEQGGQAVVFMATSEEAGRVSGAYFEDDQEVEPTSDAMNDDYARELWDKSMEWAQMK